MVSDLAAAPRHRLPDPASRQSPGSSSPAPTSRRSRGSPIRSRPRPARASAIGSSRRLGDPPLPHRRGDPGHLPRRRDRALPGLDLDRALRPAGPPHRAARDQARDRSRLGRLRPPAAPDRPARGTRHHPRRQDGRRHGRRSPARPRRRAPSRRRLPPPGPPTSPRQGRPTGRARGAVARRSARLLLEGNRLGRAFVFDQARKKTLAETRGHYPAPLRALEVIRTGLDRGDRRRLRRRGARDRRARHLAALPRTWSTSSGSWRPTRRTTRRRRAPPAGPPGRPCSAPA